MAKRIILVAVLLSPVYQHVWGQCKIGKSIAVFFAVSDYQEDALLSNLSQPIKEARDLAGILANHYGFDTIVIENPDKLRIEAAINLLSDATDRGDNDQLLLYFSGHGERAYFLPKDSDRDRPSASAIALDRSFFTQVDALPFFHQLIVFDACFSGSLSLCKSGSSRPNITDRLLERLKQQSQERILSCHQQNSTRLVLTSADANSKSPASSKVAFEFRNFLTSNTDGNILFMEQLEPRISTLPSNPLFDYFTCGANPAGRFLFIPQNILQRHQGDHACAIATDHCGPEDAPGEEALPTDPSGLSYFVDDINGQQWITGNLRYKQNEQSDLYIFKDKKTGIEKTVRETKYGRLYTWDEAKSACNSLSGHEWRLPSLQDWRALIATLTKPYFEEHDKIKRTAKHKFEAIKSIVEASKKGNEERRVWKFEKGGFRTFKGKYQGLGEKGLYWTIDEANGNSDAKAISFSERNGLEETQIYKEWALSCMCVKDIQ